MCKARASRNTDVPCTVKINRVDGNNPQGSGIYKNGNLGLSVSIGRPLDPRMTFHWGAEGAPWQREALPDAEGGANRRPAQPPEKR